jgi:hypothetical protein
MKCDRLLPHHVLDSKNEEPIQIRYFLKTLLPNFTHKHLQG